MGKRAKKEAAPETEGYKQTLHNLQVELVKLHRHLIKNDLRILILLEGRDASGKDGVVKRVTAHLSPRDTRVVALGKPSINHESGLLGVSETSSDLRDLLDREASDVRAAEAVALFCYQVKQWIGAFAAALGGLDTLIFAGGIGENAPVIRARICGGLSFLGVQFDENRNAVGEPVISADAGHVQVRVIRTDEDVIIAKAVFRMLAGTEPSQHAHFEE
jgi:acetate kinase